jgi:subtilase family serine protease
VIDFAKSNGLTVKRTHPNRTLLDVTGSVADIEKAFHVHMFVYKHPAEARTFFAPDVEPSLDLDTPVLAISGLDNYVKPRPRIHPPSVSPNVQLLGGGGGGGGGGPYEGYDFLNAYAPGVSQDGTGQSLGLFELFGFNGQDITDYEDECGISPYVSVTPVLIDGASGSDDVDYIDDCGYLAYAFEATGDIEMAISMAPGLSSVLVYEGPTPLDEPPLGTNYIQDATTTAQINDVFNRMATDNQAKQLSCSYGMDINLSTVQIFQQFAAQGQSLFIASGDFGAFSSAIDEPADDPYATIVGGTTLTTSSDAGWESETTWIGPAGTDECGNPVPPQASSGGISTVYSIPSWQQGVSMTANQGSTTMRNSPDVSLVANNINVVWGNTLIGSSSDWTVTGTSLATPLWAGFIALVNQQAAANSQPSIGFANPALYAIGKSTNYLSCFHDITTGSNTNSSSPNKYYAAAGYDLCTGWGTMIGGNLMSALLAPPTETLLVTPPQGFTSFGPGGGPFTVPSQTYTLKNIGLMPMNWSLVNTSTWLTVSSTSGNLSAAASTTLTISLNPAANNFLIAHVSGNVVLNNLTAGTTQNRHFDLYAGNGGFETGGIDDWTLVGSTELNFALSADDADVAGAEALPGQPDSQFVRSGLYGGYLGEWASPDLSPVPPAVGSLSQSVATTAGQQYLVSFWLTCVPDSSGVTTNNQFIAKWNNSALYAQTNLNAFSWTNLQFVVPATSTRTTLEFDFNNDPGAFGLDDVTVEPVPAPVFQPVARMGGTINLTWSSIPNVAYQVESASSLSNPIWTNVVKITAAGNQTGTTQPVGSAKQQFYRVILLPAP